MSKLSISTKADTETKVVFNLKVSEADLAIIKKRADTYANGNASAWMRYAAMKLQPNKSDLKPVASVSVTKKVKTAKPVKAAKKAVKKAAKAAPKKQAKKVVKTAPKQKAGKAVAAKKAVKTKATKGGGYKFS